MKRFCPTCQQHISRSAWVGANLLRWHIICPHCNHRFHVIHQKPWQEKLEIMLAVLTGFFLFKFFGNLLLALIIAMLVQWIPALTVFWLTNTKWIVPIALILGVVIFRATFLVFLYRVSRVQ